MKFDLRKIINIKTKKEINKFNINEPIHNTNYLFHYLIISGNLKGLSLIKQPIYKENSDSLNAFHLSAKEQQYDIICYLLEHYPDYIYNRNNKNEAFSNYLELDKFSYLIKKYKNIDWEDLINYGSPKPLAIVKNILLHLDYKQLTEFIKVFKITIDNNHQLLSYLVANKNITSANKVKILDTFTIDELNIKNFNNEGLIIRAIEAKDDILIEYLIKKGIDLDYHSNTGYPLFKCLYNDIVSNNFTNTLLIYNKIKDNERFYIQVDKYLDNIASKLLQIRLYTRQTNIKLDYSFDKKVLSQCNEEVWNQQNTNKLTPLYFLIKMNYDIYHVFIKNIKVNKNTLKQLVESIDDSKDTRWKKLLLSLKTININNDIKLESVEYSNATLFQAKFTDVSIFSLYLINKYKDLYLPKMVSNLIKNAYIDENTSYPFADDIIIKEPIFPWLINYYSKNEYYIHPYLNNLINAEIKNNNKKFACIFISSISDTYLHANILLYDFKNKTVERFEPYGNLVGLDLTIDDILEEELTWNTGLKYIRPSDYLPFTSFQMISDENNNKYKKPGDFGGFCLAWCIWYIENRLLNPNVEPDILVNKLIKILSQQDNSFIEYIRNYANKINVYRINILKKVGISENNISNIHIKRADEHKIMAFIINKFS
jgi:hypothetical protein